MSGITGVTGVCSSPQTNRDTTSGYHGASGSRRYVQERQKPRSFNIPERPIVRKYIDADGIEYTEITL